MKFNYPVIFSFVTAWSFRSMYIPAGTDTALCQPQGYMKNTKESLVCHECCEISLHTQENPRNTYNQCEAAGRQGVLTALVGFLDRTLDLSFSGSPTCSLFSGSFTVLCISFSGTTEQKMRLLQNLLMFSITFCYLFYLLLLVRLHHSKWFVELLVIPYTRLFRLP